MPLFHVFSHHAAVMPVSSTREQSPKKKKKSLQLWHKTQISCLTKLWSRFSFNHTSSWKRPPVGCSHLLQVSKL